MSDDYFKRVQEGQKSLRGFDARMAKKDVERKRRAAELLAMKDELAARSDVRKELERLAMSIVRGKKKQWICVDEGLGELVSLFVLLANSARGVAREEGGHYTEIRVDDLTDEGWKLVDSKLQTLRALRR